MILAARASRLETARASRQAITATTIVYTCMSRAHTCVVLSAIAPPLRRRARPIRRIKKCFHVVIFMAKIFRMCLVLTVSPLPPHTRLEDKFRQGPWTRSRLAALARRAGGRPRGRCRAAQRVGGTGTASLYAEVGAEGMVSAGDDGVAVSGGAYAGIGVGVDGTASVGGGGVTTTVGGGVSEGLIVGAGGSAHGTYQDGVVSFGMSGELAFLIGVQFDFTIEIDIAEFTDSMIDVADFLGNDFANFFENDVIDFAEDVGSALNPSNWW